MKVALYGIRNCDTMKKARAWLEAEGIDYDFHDYKVEGVEEGRLKRWIGQVGWERLLNRAGTTFRKLPDEDKQDLDERRAVIVMLAHSSTIKRPVVEAGDKLLVGFDPERYRAVLK